MLQVLIVDDDRKVCKCLETMIHWELVHCFPPVFAHDGKEALRRIGEKKPDILISDVRMPVMDGVSLCREIRDNGANMEIIFLSAYEDFTTAREAIKFGVSDYILKPLNREKLRDLEAMLLRAAVCREDQHAYRELIIDAGHREAFLTHLWQNDVAYVKALFNRIEKMKSLDLLQMQNVYMWILDILYQYYEHAAGVSYELVRQMYAQDMQNLKGMGSREEKLRYITECVYGEKIEKLMKSGEEMPVAKRIRNYMKENFRDASFNVSSVAEYFHFTLTYIGKIFAEAEHITLSEYLFSLRIEEAKRLLGRDRKSVV